MPYDKTFRKKDYFILGVAVLLFNLGWIVEIINNV